MNMKKTIAAVAAGAVAVSAMATSVSAIDVLEHGTSDLAFETQTIKYNLVKEVTVVAESTVTVMAYFDSVDMTAVKAIELGVENIKAISNIENPVKSIKVSGYYLDNAGNATSTLPPINYVTDKNANLYNAQLDPVDGSLKLDLQEYGLLGGANAQATTKANITVTYEIKTQFDGQGKINDNLNFTNKHSAATATVILTPYTAGQQAPAVTQTTEDMIILTDGDVKVLVQAGTDYDKYVYHVDAATAANTGWYKKADTTFTTKISTIVNVGASADGDTFEIVAPVAPAADLVAGAEIHGTPRITDFAKGEKKELRPFATYLNDGINGWTGEVTARLKELGYVNYLAVINDLIANYDDVTFTFNTAAQPVKERDDINESYYDADGNKTFTKFGQHLYNLYGEEGKDLTGYINYNWTGYNLFTGALIINNNLSMSLNDTAVFDYGETSLSFKWEDLNNGAAYNPVVNYVQSIKLATSRVWYWDNLVITGAMTEAEDASTAEGTEAEEETIEEAEEEEEVVEEEETEEEPVVEEEEPAAPAENPETGNAPIALAVIPVALAAAAVVAKKRG